MVTQQLATSVLPPGAEDDIKWALTSFILRNPQALQYQDYMMGRHKLAFATEQYRQAFRNLLLGLRLNMCPAVVHAITDRMHITGFAPIDTGKDESAQAAWTLWQDSRLARHAAQVHDLAMVGGDGYILVWPDVQGRPQFYPQTTADMTVRYDQETLEMVVAAKLWWNNSFYRLNLYYPDRIEKYRGRQEMSKTMAALQLAIQTSYNANLAAHLTVGMLSLDPNMFEPFVVEGEAWPLPNPYGAVPVFHFANSVGIGQFGLSELHDVIPLQDAINKTLADMVIAAEFGAYPQRYALGLELDVDDKGNTRPPPFKVGVDRFLVVGNPDAKVGSLPATDLQPYLNIIDGMIADIGRVTGIPLHHLLLTGQFPSGESQKTAEARLVAKVSDLQTEFGDVWEDCLAFALRIQGIADARLSAVWQDPQSRAELDHVSAVAIKREKIGISEHQAWRELGYSEDQIQQMDEDKASEPVAAADAFSAAFNRGSA